MISADPVAWYRPDPHQMGAENYAELVEVINDPDTVRAMLEDYRAALERRPRGRPCRPARRAHHRLPDAWSLWSQQRRHRGALWRPASRSGRRGPRTFAAVSIDSGPHIAEENPERPGGRRSQIF